MSFDDTTIVAMSPEAILNRNFLNSIYDELPEERQRIISLLSIRAAEIGIKKEFSAVIRAYNKADQELSAEYRRQNARKNNLNLDYDSSGRPMATIDNFLKVLKCDEKFQGLKYNELTYSPEKTVDGKLEKWTDVDDAETRHYIENVYHFHSVQKCDDALKIVFSENRYHPIRQIIDAVEWDGVSRIYDFLHTWTKCEDTPYTREVSRLIFAGGIHRLYNPGCKFDDMPVLIGTRQGEGKSTLVRWLALQDEFFTEVTEFEGNTAIEQLSGAWVCEVSELLAMTKTKEQEAIKSYLTRLKDKYREPYTKRAIDRPRQCIFIGTTNKEQFLTDKTGNRRYYPVKVNQSGYELFAHEAECKAYILQCWAEAKALFHNNNFSPFADQGLTDSIREAQESAVEDDYRVGLIAGYLEQKEIVEVCALELWRHALQSGEYSKPTKKDSIEIGLIMQSFPEWEKRNEQKRFPGYGKQRFWARTKQPEEPKQPFNNDDFEEIF